VERHDLEENVSIAFKRAKTHGATSKKISFYPPKEVMRLVAHAVNDQDAALFLDRRIHRPAGQRAARPAVGARSTSLARSCTSSAGSPTKAARTSLRATGFDPCR